MRSVEMSLRWLVWAKTADAPKNRNAPEPWHWPWEEQPADEVIKGEAMTLDEARDWLGWERQVSGVDQHRAFPDPDVDTHRAFDQD